MTFPAYGRTLQDPRARLWADLSSGLRARVKPADEDLYAFMRRVSPTLDAPEHLSPIFDLLDRTRTTPVRAVITAPPQHGKTEAVKHALLLTMERLKRRNAYVTYETGRAREVSRSMQWIAAEAGGEIEGNLSVWRWHGGSMLATGIGGPLTGYGIDGVLFVDDPVKNRAEAESKTIRDKQWDWFRSVAQTRVHPGASTIIVLTRWHPDDLGGRALELGFEEVRLPAINDGSDPRRPVGAALWERRRPLAWLEEQREILGDYEFEALYQGSPRVRGSEVFGEPQFFDRIPMGTSAYSIGVDLAYSEGSHSDYSCAVVLRFVAGVAYVVDVVRARVEAPKFKAMVRDLRRRYPGATVRGYLAGTEKGAVSFFNNPHDGIGAVDLVAMPAREGKLARAQHVSAAWNRGAVLVPGTQVDAAGLVVRPSPEWVGPFVSELRGFTGINDKHDDQVDALAAAYAPAAQVQVTRRVANLPPG